MGEEERKTKQNLKQKGQNGILSNAKVMLAAMLCLVVKSFNCVVMVSVAVTWFLCHIVLGERGRNVVSVSCCVL